MNKNRQAVTTSIVFAAVFLEPRRIPGTEEASSDCFLREGITSRGTVRAVGEGRGGAWNDLGGKKAYRGLAGTEMHRQRVGEGGQPSEARPRDTNNGGEGRWGAAMVLECGKGWIRFGL